MKKETQNVRVAKWLVTNGSITTAQAMGILRITRLAARVNDIKKIYFIDIDSELVKWGDSKQARYTVDEEERAYLKYCLDGKQL